MPKVSIIILTKDRAGFLKQALESVRLQTFFDYEVIVVNDGSRDSTPQILKDSRLKDLKILNHQNSVGIIKSRQEALQQAAGEYVAFLDDDDEWVDKDKLKKQVEFLEKHQDYVLVGGGIVIRMQNEELRMKNGGQEKFRPTVDAAIRKTMLLRNNFFTSTVMFRKSKALEAGGFISDGVDVAEDYDLWLRMGRLGKMYNFKQVFTSYRQSSYNKAKFRKFLLKQLALIKRHKTAYEGYYLSSIILNLRLFLNF